MRDNVGVTRPSGVKCRYMPYGIQQMQRQQAGWLKKEMIFVLRCCMIITLLRY